MLVGVRMPVTMRVAVLMRMTLFMRMVMSILMIVVLFMHMVMRMIVVLFMVVRMRMGNARDMQRLVLLLRQFVPDGFRRGTLAIFNSFLSFPRHYSTSSASTNTLMV